VRTVVGQSAWYQPVSEPASQSLEIHVTGCNSHNQIVDRFVIWDIQLVSTAVDQYLRQDPSRSLIAVGKSVISNHTMKQGRSLAEYWPVISGIGAGNRRLDKMQTYYAGPTAIRQRFVMSFERVGECYSIMTLTDLRASSTHLCVSETRFGPCRASPRKFETIR